MEILHKIGEALAALSTQEQIALALAGGAFLLLLLMVVLLRRPHEEHASRGGSLRSRLDEAVTASETEVATLQPSPIIDKPQVDRLSQVAQPSVQPAARAAVMVEPQDSILRRHYLSELAAKKRSQTNPYPTDSILRRHYLHLIQSQR